MGKREDWLADRLARRDELQEIAKAILAEAEIYAAPEHPQDTRWKGTPPSEKQLRLIRMRRAGPEFRYRLPEALYRALMIALTGEPTSKAIRSRGQAVAYLDAVNHIDPFHLQRIERIIAALEREEGLFAEGGDEGDEGAD